MVFYKEEDNTSSGQDMEICGIPVKLSQTKEAPQPPAMDALNALNARAKASLDELNLIDDEILNIQRQAASTRPLCDRLETHALNSPRLPFLPYEDTEMNNVMQIAFPSTMLASSPPGSCPTQDHVSPMDTEEPLEDLSAKYDLPFRDLDRVMSRGDPLLSDAAADNTQVTLSQFLDLVEWCDEEPVFLGLEKKDGEVEDELFPSPPLKKARLGKQGPPPPSTPQCSTAPLAESGNAPRPTSLLALADHSYYCIDPNTVLPSPGNLSPYHPQVVSWVSAMDEDVDLDSGVSGSSRCSSNTASPNYPGPSHLDQLPPPPPPPAAAAAAAAAAAPTRHPGRGRPPKGRPGRGRPPKGRPPKGRRGRPRKALPEEAAGVSCQEVLGPHLAAALCGQPTVGAPLPGLPNPKEPTVRAPFPRPSNPKGGARAPRRGQGPECNAEEKLRLKKEKNEQKARKERERRKKSKELLDVVKTTVVRFQPGLQGKRVSHKATLDSLIHIFTGTRRTCKHIRGIIARMDKLIDMRMRGVITWTIGLAVMKEMCANAKKLCGEACK